MTTPLPAASPSAFSTTGQPNSPARITRSASSSVSAVWKRAVGTPCRAMKAFANALLDSRRAASAVGPSSSRPAAANSVGNAEAQRQFRSDDGEVDLFAVGQVEDRRRVRDVAGNRPGDSRDAGISGCADQFADVPIGGQPGNEGMFPGAAADHENSHR